MRFNVGDEVRIKARCEKGKIYGNNSFTSNMEQYKDMKLIISQIFDDEYHIREDDRSYYYNDEMLEPFEFKVGDKVKLVRLDDEKVDDHKSYKENLGKIFTIRRIDDDINGKYASFEEEFTIVPYLKNLELIKNCKDEEIVSNQDETVKINLDNGDIKVDYDKFKLAYSGILRVPSLEEPKIELSTSISTTRLGENLLKREENYMEILNIYVNRKREEIRRKYSEKEVKVKEEDKVHQIISDAENRLNVLLDRDEDNQVHLCFYALEESTENKLREIDKERCNKLEELSNFIEEVKAQLEIAETYETKIDILKNYEILDESGKISNGKTNTETKKAGRKPRK